MVVDVSLLPTWLGFAVLCCCGGCEVDEVKTSEVTVDLAADAVDFVDVLRFLLTTSMPLIVWAFCKALFAVSLNEMEIGDGVSVGRRSSGVGAILRPHRWYSRRPNDRV